MLNKIKYLLYSYNVELIFFLSLSLSPSLSLSLSLSINFFDKTTPTLLYLGFLICQQFLATHPLLFFQFNMRLSRQINSQWNVINFCLEILLFLTFAIFEIAACHFPVMVFFFVYIKVPTVFLVLSYDLVWF